MLDDKAIRAGLKEHVLDQCHTGLCRVLHEMPLGNFTSHKVIADVLVVDRRGLHAYEIKSDKDTPYRLARQVEAYEMWADSLTLVCGRKLYGKCRDIALRGYVGLVVVDEDELSGQPKFTRIAPAIPWPQDDETAAGRLTLCWTTDIRYFLSSRCGVPSSVIKGCRKWDLLKYAEGKCTADQVRQWLIEEYGSRDSWRSDAPSERGAAVPIADWSNK